METMATAVHQSTQAIDRMTTSVQETARNIGDLEGYIAGTSGSMTELTKAISQVEGNAQDTVLLSTQASAAATVGGEALRGFSFALFIGVLVGTYSSVFIATPIVLDTLKKKA